MKKIHILCDAALFFAVIAFAVVSSIVTIETMYGVVREDTVADPSDIILIRMLFGILLFVLWLVLIASSPRYLCIITLTKTAITVWIPFKKRKTFSYKQFSYVYCGRYFHGNVAGIGKNVWYIVLAQRHLSANELNSINRISNSEEIVKVRFTPKNFQKLQSFLPGGHINQLNRAATRMFDK